MDIKEINRRVIEQFRAGGEIEGMQRDRLLLLTTVGARIAQRRTTPPDAPPRPGAAAMHPPA